MKVLVALLAVFALILFGAVICESYVIWTSKVALKKSLSEKMALVAELDAKKAEQAVEATTEQEKNKLREAIEAQTAAKLTEANAQIATGKTAIENVTKQLTDARKKIADQEKAISDLKQQLNPNAPVQSPGQPSKAQDTLYKIRPTQ